MCLYRIHTGLVGASFVAEDRDALNHLQEPVETTALNMRPSGNDSCCCGGGGLPGPSSASKSAKDLLHHLLDDDFEGLLQASNLGVVFGVASGSLTGLRASWCTRR